MNGTIQINTHVTGLMPQQINKSVVAVNEYTVISEAKKMIAAYGIDKSTITSCIFIADKVYIPLENL